MTSRILIVDDEPINIQMLTAVLGGKGYEIEVATSGEAALEALTRVPPNLILLDVMMPGIDGFETCQRIKATPALRDIPLIFLTGRRGSADIVRGFELGAVDYVAKPFNTHELLARVRTHLTLDHFYQENQRLLLNVLPASIAEKLKKQPGVIAERFEDVSVLFADLVGFTSLAARLNPTQLLEMLNVIFSGFDELADRRGLEKIKTMGDSYMVAGGLPNPHPDHLGAMAALALDMQDKIVGTRTGFGSLDVRIGLHTGSVIAGVIGIRKFTYDVWGDTVNTASRLVSHGVPGRVHVSDTVYQRLKDRFEFEPRGTIELKGRGPITAYFLGPPL
jgi:adenylate cyclase